MDAKSFGRAPALAALTLMMALTPACGDERAIADAGPDAGSGFDAADASEPQDAAPASDTGAGADASDASDAGVLACNACHGSAENAAPPRDTSSNTSTVAPGVGAHQSHLTPRAYFRPVRCDECHSVPKLPSDPGHMDDPLPAELAWGAIATGDGGVAAKYEGGTCTVHCHGATLGGGKNTKPTWTKVDATQAKCGTCHGVPPPKPHPRVSTPTCSPCHPNFDGLMPIDPTLHVNGVVEVKPCGSCHAVPPATGAHLRHYGDVSSPPLASYADLDTVASYRPQGAPYYMFGCGNCHPLLEDAHGNGKVDVELYDPSAPPASLKARSPKSASWSAGKCADVYCHSSGQASPAFVPTPAWSNGALPAPRCAACHDNPPRYPSGGGGSATANTHVVMGDDGWELGHFGGLPGPWHGSYHGAGAARAAPITCQTCHFETVDPANVGPGGFYYLDTEGLYDLGGSLKYACGTCHTGAANAPAIKSGAVRTARHVDGAREVTFDPRTTLPINVVGLPAAPNRPSRPYWIAGAIPSALPPSSSADGTTWSLSLDGATYDPKTKACANVPCHVRQSFGGAPLLWGTTPVGWATCSACHF